MYREERRCSFTQDKGEGERKYIGRDVDLPMGVKKVISPLPRNDGEMIFPTPNPPLPLPRCMVRASR